jgi:hypothetical protein
MICEEVYFLHTSVFQVELEARYAEVAIKWRMDFPEFARYFAAQWILGNFTNWKIYCSEPGIASTNNAVELFNNIIKKSYTPNTRHSLSALVDIFMELLLFDYSMDLKDLRKCFELCHLPAVAVKEASERIDGANYLIREEDNPIVTYRKQGSNVSYAVDCNSDSGTCMCHSYMKWGYYKHLLHAHALLNEDSLYIIIDLRFKYKGNTKITKRQRGRVRDALPALQVM